MLRLHHAPVACSLASRFALIEADLPHEIIFVRTWQAEHKSDAYRVINPRGKVPALQTEHGVLTESTAILPYIADLAPEKQLFPPAGTFARAQGQAWLSFLSCTLHSAVSGAMFPSEHLDEAGQAAALARAAAAYQDVDDHLTGRDHILDAPSICDLYLLVFALWRVAPTLRDRLPVYPNIDRLQHRLLSRSTIAGVVGEEMTLRAAGR